MKVNSKYLNVGCGNKFHKDWTNIDIKSSSSYVIAYNLIKGLPFKDNSFEVVYHSQVLEHIPKENAADFIKECFRVLEPGGIIRIVVPDLENIVNEYCKYLHENLNNRTALSEANYDWILLEMYDQTVRNQGGGEMAKFVTQPNIINEEYIGQRTGLSGQVQKVWLHKDNTFSSILKRNKLTVNSIIKGVRYIISKVSQVFMTKKAKLGAFRLGGEVHYWMYDRFSLGRLLKQQGFENVEVKTPFDSKIKDWARYQLDVKDGLVYDPTSLFIEARKPK